MKKKLFALLLVSLMLLTMFAGCTDDAAPANSGGGATTSESGGTSSTTAAAGEKSIAILFQTMSFKRYPEADGPSFEAACQKLGYTPLVQVASDDSEKQIQQAENVISQGVSAIILQPCSDAAAATIVDMAKEEGIPVVGYNDMVNNVELDAFVGRDNYGMWQDAAKLFCDKYPSGNYVLANGDESYMAARVFQESYSDIVNQYPDITVVSEQWNDNWSAESAMRQAEAALSANNDDITAVICANDPIATGVLQALEAVDMLGEVGLIGCDAELNVCKAIVEGNMDFTCFTECSVMAEDAVTLADCLIRGVDFPADIDTYDNGYDVPFLATDVLILSADNMPEFLETHSWWLTVEEVYANVPESEWPKTA